MTGMEPLAYLAARILTCGSWIAAGLHAATHYKETVQSIADHGIPLPRLVLPIVLLVEFGGAALLFADQYTWAVCLVWIAFLILATYFYHRQFVTPEGELDFIQYTKFWKNVSMVGGVVALILLDTNRPDWLLRG